MKKWIAILMAILLTFSVIGCSGGGEDKQASGDVAQEEGEKIDFPTKNLSLIVPWDAGGGTDAVARGLAKEAEEFLGQTVIVNNVSGGGGAVGHGAGIAAEADGYTMTLITFELISLPPQGLVPFTYEDFDLLCQVNMDPAALTVHKDAPYDTLEEFIDYAKENPGEINIGNAGPGSVWHIAAGLLEDKLGLEFEHVPFDGAAPAVTALVGKHIDAVSVSPAEVQGQVEAGDLKMLAVMSDDRVGNFPDVPTFKEQDVDVVFGTWRGLAVPKGTPEEVRAILGDAFKKSYEAEGFQTFAKNSGLGLIYLNAEDFKTYLDEASVNVEQVMQSLGLAE